MKSLIEYTDQALTLLGGVAPSVVWLPPSIKARRARVDTKGIVTTHPHSQDEINERVLQADPLGFLIAIMNGQPIPRFHLQATQSTLPPAAIEPKADERAAKGTARQGKKPPAVVPTIKLDTKDGVDINIDFELPTLANRERIAMYLMENFAPIAAVRRAGKAGIAASKNKSVASDDRYEKMLDKRAREANTPETEE